MLKKLFAAIVSAAMLFCMSTSALSVHAEDPVSITIEGAENDTIDLYFRENSNIETVRGRRFLLEPHEEFDELEFSVIDGEEVLSIPWIYKLDRDEWNGQVWFNFLSEGTAVVQASIGDTVIKTFTVNTHLGKYVNRFETRESYLNILVGEELNLRDYVLSMAYPAGADYSDEEFTYRIDYDTSNSVEISGDILKCTESCQVGVFVKSKADAEHSIYLAGISTPISSIGFNQDNYSQKFVEDSEENIVLTYPTTTPDNAIVGLPVEEVQISVSDTSIAEIGDIGEPLYRIPVRFKKPGSVELTIKYNDFTATTVVKCYLEKAPETIIAPDSVKGYKGYTNSFYVDFGPDQEVNKDVIFEVIEGKDIVSLSKSKDYTGRAAGLGNNGHYCYYDGIGIGKAVIRAKSAVNENVYKDVVVEITDDPAPAPTLTIMLNGREEVPVKNDSITVEKDVTLVFQYSYVAMPNEGSSDFLGTENLFNQVEASKILDIAGGGGGGGDILSGFRIAFRTVEYGSDTFEVLPGKFLKINVVENITEEPETPSDKPTVETGSAEDTKVEVSDAISKEDAAVITETLAKAEVTAVVDTIKPEAKEALIAELTKGIDTEGKEVTLSVVNTVKVTAADLKSENKSITYEISPKAVVTVDGVAVNTVDLKNAQLTGNKDIEVTLPINGLDLKEIVHKSEGYDPEYIYDFVISKEGTVTFKISHFSSFTLNEVITKPAEPSKGTVGTVSPNTGDHTEVMLYGGIGIVALIGALAVILFRRKHA